MGDGMTVDQDGYVWSARWDGHGLFRFDTEGNLERKIEFPTAMVSSVTFGGEDYTDIYATTAGGNDKANNGEEAGALLLLTLGFLIQGCVATKIATIQQDINLYKDQQISIRGTVTETLTV